MAISDRKSFILVLSVALITDILDGAIARIFNWRSELGARLDSTADLLTFIAAVVGIEVFEPKFIKENAFILTTVVCLWLLPYVISLLRFRKIPYLHLYSVKITGYLIGIFFFSFFVFGGNQFYFYFTATISSLAFIEESLVVVIIPEMKADVKGIYWVMRERNSN